MNKSSNTRCLYYGEHLIGRVKDAFCTDDTWYGILDKGLELSDDLARKLATFMTFCEDWNERARESQADVREFEPYEELLKSGVWKITDEYGDPSVLSEAPAFFSGGEVAWRQGGDHLGT
jgi:hypothetical protein